MRMNDAIKFVENVTYSVEIVSSKIKPSYKYRFKTNSLISIEQTYTAFQFRK